MREVLLSIAELAPFDVVARRLAEAAMQLTDADYAALGAYDRQRRLEHFEAVGLTDAERAAIRHAPEGLGLLGEFALHPETINLPSASDHPRAAGFPAEHPAMGPFLGVPVMYASEPIGAFYVARPPGRKPFSRREQERLEELTPYAAIAMANARMLESEHRRVAIAEALAAAARSLQQRTDERQIGEVLADALEAIFADAAELAACWNTADAEHQHPPRWDGTALCQALDHFVDGRSEPGPVDDAELGAELVPGRHATVHVARLDDGGKLALVVAHPAPVTISDEGRVALSTLAEIGAIALAAARRREDGPASRSSSQCHRRAPERLIR